MKIKILPVVVFICITLSIEVSAQIVEFKRDQLRLVNRELIALDEQSNSLTLNNQLGDGMAIVEGLDFDEGIIEIELKGENNPGRSFVGLAFNIQNDSTYEAVYFRPFNFQSNDENRRAHSMQYIHHPKYTWKYLRTNNEGQFESDFPRQPSPDEWFRIRLKIDKEKVTVYDMETSNQLLSVDRLSSQVSDQIGLWTGFNSNGSYRSLKMIK